MPNPKLQAVQGFLFHVFSYPPKLGAVSFIHNIRTQHAVVIRHVPNIVNLIDGFKKDIYVSYNKRGPLVILVNKNTSIVNTQF
jgi:hypothetical protein